MINDLLDTVAALRPGESVAIGYREAEMCSPSGNIGDAILEMIIGSGYEFYYNENPYSITFSRLPEPLTSEYRTYVSPDQRRYFTKSGNLYHPNGTARGGRLAD